MSSRFFSLCVHRLSSCAPFAPVQKLSRWINLQSLYKTYGPVVAVLLVVLFVIYIRFR
jgi:hypothetical protein